LPDKALAPMIKTPIEASKLKPASDEVFRSYRAMYAYDRKPLREQKQPVKQDSADWRKESITFDAAYNSERLTAYLFLPVNIKPPYQTVVFFPSARPIGMPSSKSLADMNYIDYIIRSGRAVIYPVYKGTYERSLKDDLDPTTAIARDVMLQQFKDMARSIDYLETRPDIDRNKIGFLGFSMGGTFGFTAAALDDRLKAIILLEGGIPSENVLPGTSPVDFASRIKQPVLMINGTYDMIWVGYEELFKLLGTAPADKKLVKFQTGHAVIDDRARMMREVISWLGQYLGRIN
jgi:eukaryotic-like serine/threonine-protein kinase